MACGNCFFGFSENHKRIYPTCLESNIQQLFFNLLACPILIKYRSQIKKVKNVRHYARINVKPQGGGGGGGAIPGEFDIFMEARVKFPAPGQLMNVKFQPLVSNFSSESQIIGALCMFKISTQGKPCMSISRA